MQKLIFYANIYFNFEGGIIVNMKEILDNFIMGRESENFNNKKAKKSEMSERERFERIYSHKVNKDVYEYLESHFYDLKIFL